MRFSWVRLEEARARRLKVSTDYLIVVIIFATAKVYHIAQAAAGANVSCELMHVKSVTCTVTGTLL